MKIVIFLLTLVGLWYAYQAQWLRLPKFAATQTVYRYQDNQGLWHFSDTPPAGGALQQALPSWDEPVPPTRGMDPNTLQTPSLGRNWLDAISQYIQTLGNGQEVINQAKQLQIQTQDRQRALEHLGASAAQD